MEYGRDSCSSMVTPGQVARMRYPTNETSTTKDPSATPPPCEHDLCTLGAPLEPACHWCVELVGNLDSLCVNYWWDTLYGQSCHQVCNPVHKQNHDNNVTEVAAPSSE
ncbi:hypothetical protein BJ742DRAFT_776848 [Cladochytrium replicatum]|nr:hypothetical protein BJ742DRAFT_776848 [Cladochytrium replicatum]